MLPGVNDARRMTERLVKWADQSYRDVYTRHTARPRNHPKS